VIITIDGPAGTGKTTVAKTLAAALGFVYVDTGAMYRMVTWFFLQKHIDLKSHIEVERALENFTYVIKEQKSSPCYFVCGEDVTQAIRSQEVTAAVSAVSAIPTVRTFLWDRQRALAKEGDTVFEGRDMGSFVLPHADVKIFLSATPQVRAKRRHKELEGVSEERVRQDLELRDALDSSRELAPLCCPEGAHVIDTSALSIEEVVDVILHIVK